MTTAGRSIARPVKDILARAREGTVPDAQDAFALVDWVDSEELIEASAAIRDRAYGDVLTYSRKVFIPLTQLCRNSCAYCTFAHPPRRGERSFLGRDQVLDIARRGADAGCHEALFTLGDKPELRYSRARAELASLGHATTLSYLVEMADLVRRETGLLPHVNAGVMSREDLAALRRVSVSQGLMLETASNRLSMRGGPHFGSPDKWPAPRLATMEAAGAEAVPFTSGILIGIGETRRERVEALLALRALHQRHGHLQEIILQNFRAKTRTPMQHAPEPTFEDHLWTIAVARIVMPNAVSIQAPPNLSVGGLDRLIAAGINDFGGISPVTPDHVNPEAPWPAAASLAAECERAGKALVARLAVYPAYVRDEHAWIDERLRPNVHRVSDSDGLARVGSWRPGASIAPVLTELGAHPRPLLNSPTLEGVLERARAGRTLDETAIVGLFRARGPAVARIVEAADGLRREVCGQEVSFVVNRNINYTNVCTYRCGFCAFSKGKLSESLRGRPYDLDHDEISRRVAEAWDRGATEVCLQGGIHPAYTGATYLSILKTVRAAAPHIHIHAFSPLEISHGAATLGRSVRHFLAELRDAGLASLPGTAAEILDDEVRQIICPDKLKTQEWLDVMRAAHELGLRSTATIMFGHVDAPHHWARHLMRLRDLQADTGGFTEFVPLPFVPDETPIYLKGRARRGATLREAILMHAVARLVLHPVIRNVQASWVKLGPDGAVLALNAGANDVGGTLMNETISRAAGASHGQEIDPIGMETMIHSTGRIPRQRSTLYGDITPERAAAGRSAAPLAAMIQTPLATTNARLLAGARGNEEARPPQSLSTVVFTQDERENRQ